MHTSKSIAYALLRALRQGEDPKELARKMKATFSHTSQSSQILTVLFYLKKFSEIEESAETCSVESTAAVTSEDLRKIQEIFGAKVRKVQLSPELLGGFKARYNGLLYDGTLLSRLETLRTAIV